MLGSLNPVSKCPGEVIVRYEKEDYLEFYTLHVAVAA